MAQLVPTRLGSLGVRVEGSGPVAVLWHSMFVDSRTWDRVLPVLSRLRTVVLVDGPSFGASEPLSRLSSVEECALAAFDVLDALGIDQVDWVGNGSGGHIGMLAAATAPRRVRSLVSLGAPTHPLAGLELRRVRTFRPIMRAFGFTRPVRRILLDSILNARTRAIDPDAVRIIEDGFLGVDRRGLDWALRSFVLERPDLEPIALSLETPTVFAAGDDRSQWTPAQAEAVTSRMFDARTRTLHGVRSIAPLEDPDAVAGIIREHWATTARR